MAVGVSNVEVVTHEGAIDKSEVCNGVLIHTFADAGSRHFCLTLSYPNEHVPPAPQIFWFSDFPALMRFQRYVVQHIQNLPSVNSHTGLTPFEDVIAPGWTVRGNGSSLGVWIDVSIQSENTVVHLSLSSRREYIELLWLSLIYGRDGINEMILRKTHHSYLEHDHHIWEA